MLILNGIFEVGFRPNGITLSDSTSDLISSGSVNEFTKGDLNSAFEVLSEKVAVVGRLSTYQVTKDKIEALIEANSVFHYWNIIETVFDDHPLVLFLNSTFKNPVSGNQKAFAL